jgi:hypothetical protein
MSTIVNPTTPMNETPVIDRGLDIVGFEDRVNRLEGSENNDSIVGGNLVDILSSFAGNDTLEGLDGNDRLFGGAGNDRLIGGRGNDSLDADVGNDILEGGDGNDTLIARDGNDSLNGGGGDDRLIVAEGNNTLTGGSGRDIFQFNITEDDSETRINRITDFRPGEDRIIINGDRETAETSYDPETGIVSLDGRAIAQLNTGLTIDPNDIEFIGTNAAETPNRDGTVYRFFDENRGVHFFTASTTERDNIRENSPNFTFEGPSYSAVDPFTGSVEAVPVYRLFNTATGAYLYTTSEAERDNVIENLPNFRFEGEAFAAYNSPVEGTIPIYRFYNPTLGVYFYTPSEAERDNIEANLPEYQAEGVAYYAFDLPEDTV